MSGCTLEIYPEIQFLDAKQSPICSKVLLQCSSMYILYLLFRCYSTLAWSIPAADACDDLRLPVIIEAIDIRREGRCGGVSSSLLSLLGSIIALSSAYGRPRCRPRIYNQQNLKRRDTISAIMTSLLNVLN